MSIRDRLFIVPDKVDNPKLRLFCFPYAGGAYSSYHNWSQYLEDDYEFVFVQPPGRGSRMNEAPAASISEITSEILNYSDYLTSTPYLFFGHSLGGLIAYDLCTQIQELRMPLPNKLILSASCPPNKISGKRKISHLPEQKFIESLVASNAIPESLARNKSFLQAFLPLLRSDLRIAEEFDSSIRTINCSLSLFYGDLDETVNLDIVKAWGKFSSNDVSFHMFPGNHLFLNEQKGSVATAVNELCLSVEKV